MRKYEIFQKAMKIKYLCLANSYVNKQYKSLAKKFRYFVSVGKILKVLLEIVQYQKKYTAKVLSV